MRVHYSDMAYLVLVRHGKSEWNKHGKWTGHVDIGLVEEGINEARHAAHAIKDIPIDCAFISDLKRAQETFVQICNTLDKPDMKSVTDPALKERHYGIYTGKNKWEVQKEIGEEAFHKLRRGWDVPIPEGETLKDVYARVVPYYEKNIKPLLASCQRNRPCNISCLLIKYFSCNTFSNTPPNTFYIF